MQWCNDDFLKVRMYCFSYQIFIIIPKDSWNVVSSTKNSFTYFSKYSRVFSLFKLNFRGIEYSKPRSIIPWLYLLRFLINDYSKWIIKHFIKSVDQLSYIWFLINHEFSCGLETSSCIGIIKSISTKYVCRKMSHINCLH